MRVLHFFDEYLSNAMNWGWRMLRYTPDIQPHVAAFIHHECDFRSPDFGFKVAWYQPWLPPNAASVNTFLRGVAWLDRHYIGGYARQVEQYARAQNIELCHAHFGHIGVHWCPIAQKLGVPLVVSFYGFDLDMLPRTRPEFKAKYRQLFQEADLFLAQGNDGVETLIKLGCSPDKIKIHHLGVDVNHISLHKRVKKANHLRLIQFASFTEKKGYRYTLEAFKMALESCPNMHLTLAGHPTRPKIHAWVRQFIKQHQLTEKVSLLPPIPFSQLYAYLANFDVLIQPSHIAQNGDKEGGPVSLIDAQATGMPIISTVHCNIPDIAPHECTSLLSPECDTAAIAASIRRFYAMQDIEYQEFSRSARTHIEANYNLETTSRQLRDIYQSLVR